MCVYTCSDFGLVIISEADPRAELVCTKKPNESICSVGTRLVPLHMGALRWQHKTHTRQFPYARSPFHFRNSGPNATQY